MLKTVKNKKVTFRGQKVALAYNLLSYKFLDENGVNVMEMPEKADLSVTELITFAGAGLVYKFPDVTLDEVWTEFNSDSFDAGNMRELSEAIQDGINRFNKKSKK